MKFIRIKTTKLSLTVFLVYFFPALLISQKIMITITTTPIIPNHIPALNIPAMAWQLLRATLIKMRNGRINFNLN